MCSLDKMDLRTEAEYKGYCNMTALLVGWLGASYDWTRDLTADGYITIGVRWGYDSATRAP
jgi:hypothetical protein